MSGSTTPKRPGGAAVPEAVRPLLVTHSGTFHLDDAFAYAVLRLALGLGEAGKDHALVRTREEAVIAAADVAWDVGAVYDAEANRFDHHQRGAPVREGDGLPYSAAGLVWRRHGEAAVRALLAPRGAVGMARQSRARSTARWCAASTGSTTGSAIPRTRSGWRRWWKTSTRPGTPPRSATGRPRTRRSCGRPTCPRASCAAAPGPCGRASPPTRWRWPRTRARPTRACWNPAASCPGRGRCSPTPPLLYAVHPAPNGDWMVDAMPPERGSFGQRLPLPEGWAGLRGAEPAAASGVPDAVFVHARRFVGAARSREGAVAVARGAIGIGLGAGAAPRRR